MLREPIVRLSVSWGYDVTVELRLSKRNWSKISKGNRVTIRGNGYYYEGEFFCDYWDFSGGIDGELRVRYGSSKGHDEGVGFDGILREAFVE
jgi:hypothetical protein